MHTAFDPGTINKSTEGNPSLCSFDDNAEDFAKLMSSACATQGMIYELEWCCTMLVIWFMLI